MSGLLWLRWRLLPPGLERLSIWVWSWITWLLKQPLLHSARTAAITAITTTSAAALTSSKVAIATTTAASFAASSVAVILAASTAIAQRWPGVLVALQSAGGCMPGLLWLRWRLLSPGLERLS